MQASFLSDINLIKGKRAEQQQLQVVMRLRELAVKQKTASINQLKALLLEFKIRGSTRNGGLGGVIESVLEDAENGFSMAFRQALDTAWSHHLSIVKAISTYDICLEQSVEQNTDCKRLLKLEGVGTINATNLYLAPGCADLGTFKKGKDAAACIGLTPMLDIRFLIVPTAISYFCHVSTSRRMCFGFKFSTLFASLNPRSRICVAT